MLAVVVDGYPREANSGAYRNEPGAHRERPGPQLEHLEGRPAAVLVLQAGFGGGPEAEARVVGRVAEDDDPAEARGRARVQTSPHERRARPPPAVGLEDGERRKAGAAAGVRAGRSTVAPGPASSPRGPARQG